LSEVRSENRYEQSDVPPRLLVALAAGLALSIAGVLGALALAFPSALAPYQRGPLQPLPPQPRLQSDPAADLARYREAKRRELAGNGRDTIPIEQAMNEVAAEGWSNRR
jgi:hypothetical protein